ncbi:outer membrane protein assembly factor BamA [Allopusillimonas ginsengisoli]|uniref:outer membrane protein assembly factor BamA n=1 Tax=Allopusillimonas ginsengisoli TaxID=453575 RepID=UPI0010C18AAC|nr:outer membrane protein assembly factor BamA [Allopusillimonas ginsengisoli]
MSFSRKLHFVRRGLPALLAALVIPGIANAFTPFVVRDIQVQGIQRVDAGTIFSYLPVKVGEKFTETQAADAIQRLYSTGFFNDVRIDTSNDVLVVTVEERPTIASLSFNGMREFDAKAITQSLAKVGFGQGRVFDNAMLERARFEIEQQYLSKGKYGVEVNPIITPLPRNRVGVSFEIFEGGRAKIREIHVVGNKAFKEGTLLKEMELTTSGMMTWYTNADKYAREKLEADAETIRSFYLDRGYLEYSAEAPQVSISPDREAIFITYTIHEGEPYTVRSVKLAGELLDLNDKIEPLVKIKAGETFSAAKVNETVKAITEYLGTLGYAFANVNPNPVLDRDTHETDLTFFVDPGQRVYVRRIQVGGNTRTRDEVIRRELRQQEAAWYDGDAIKASRDRVDRLGYFNEVNVTTAPVAGSTDQIDINVDVKEKPTGLINLGVGYGTTDKLMLSAGISQDNIFGSGNTLSLQVNTSETNRAVVLSHTDPYWTLDGISKTSSIYYRRTTPYDNSYSDGDYRVTAFGGGLNFGVPISESDRVFAGISYENNKLSKLRATTPQAYKDFVEEYGESTNAVIFNVGWSKDTRDSALVPNKGSYTRLSADVSTVDLQYYMLSAQQQYYLPIGRSFTLAFNGLLDWGRAYGDKDFPVIKNVYGGGIGSVRGYEGASLGGRDTGSNDYLGGSRRIVGNVQLYLPFPGATRDRTLRWFIFADAGRVDNTAGGCMRGIGNYAEDPCGWKFASGLGFSWQSPLGPLQLSWGRALNAKKGDDKQAFQFQIGTGF